MESPYAGAGAHHTAALLTMTMMSVHGVLLEVVGLEVDEEGGVLKGSLA